MKKTRLRDQPIHSGWILYDDACGLCRWLARRWGRSLLKYGLGVSPLQAPWVKQKTGLSQLVLRTELHLLLDNGEIIRGADTYRYALRHMRWAWPLRLFAHVPPGRQLFNWGCRTLANHRHHFSRTGKPPVDQR